MLLHRMDRDGARSRLDSTHTDCDPDHDLWTDSDRHASDPDPQPDPVDHNRYHHQYRHLYPNPDLHCDKYVDPYSLPACDRDVYSYLHAILDIHTDLYFHPLLHEYIYSHCFIDLVDQHTDSVHHTFPNNPITWLISFLS